MARKPRQKAEEEPEEAGAGEEELEAEAPAQDLYAVLGVERSASQNDIRKAYHRMALKLHPDKNPGDESANEKFQTLQRVFGVLGDPEKRRIYDETGCTEDAELSGEKFNDLYDYYRTVYRKVDTEDIERFEEEYRGSQEELKDLKELYTRFKGDMNMLFEWMMCSRPKLDSHRFKDALEVAIKAGELKSSKAFRTWAAEITKKPAPKEDPLQPQKKKSKKKSGEGMDLVALIQGRQAERAQKASALFLSLEAKYGGKDLKASGRSAKSSQKRVAAEPNISDEDFAKLQEKIVQRSKKGKV